MEQTAKKTKEKKDESVMSFKDCSVHPRMWMTELALWVNETKRALAQAAQKGKKEHEKVRLFDAKRGLTDEPRAAPRAKKIVEVAPVKKGKK